MPNALNKPAQHLCSTNLEIALKIIQQMEEAGIPINEETTEKLGERWQLAAFRGILVGEVQPSPARQAIDCELVKSIQDLKIISDPEASFRRIFYPDHAEIIAAQGATMETEVSRYARIFAYRPLGLAFGQFLVKHPWLIPTHAWGETIWLLGTTLKDTYGQEFFPTIEEGKVGFRKVDEIIYPRDLVAQLKSP